MKKVVVMVMAGVLMSLAGNVHAEDEDVADVTADDTAGVKAEDMVAFLGISTRPVDSTLRSQIELPAGIGLVLTEVVPESPAEKILKKGDVLIRMGDQLLVNQQQLRVLVEIKEPGDNVDIDLLRKGREMSVEVELGEHPAIKSEEGNYRFPRGMQSGEGFQRIMFGDGTSSNGMPNMKAIKEMIGAAMGGGKEGMGMPEGSSMIISRSVYDKENGARLTLSNDTLKITKKRKVIFEGPVSTDEEKEKVPEEYREKLDELLDGGGQGTTIQMFGGGGENGASGFPGMMIRQSGKTK